MSAALASVHETEKHDVQQGTCSWDDYHLREKKSGVSVAVPPGGPARNLSPMSLSGQINPASHHVAVTRTRSAEGLEILVLKLKLRKPITTE